MIFTNRTDAGRKLASQLQEYTSKEAVVLALARGGVPVGYEVAKNLHIPLDVIGVRKLGAPMQEEYGIGAISEGDVRTLDFETIDLLNVSRIYIDQVTEKEKQELKRRVSLYRGENKFPDIQDKIVIIVDDGLATGVTARAAIAAVKKKHPKEVIFATPVCAFETAALLEEDVDDMVCLSSPPHFEAVGKWYQTFGQVTDEKVTELLRQSTSFASPQLKL